MLRLFKTLLLSQTTYLNRESKKRKVFSKKNTEQSLKIVFQRVSHRC